jgi:hypothetical protein
MSTTTIVEILIAAVAVGAVYAVMRGTVPEIRRYINIRRM